MVKVTAQVLSVLSLVVSSSVFALSCPNNGKILSPGSTTEDVVASCGQPTSWHKLDKTVVTSETWTYFIKSQIYNQKLVFYFKNDGVTNISVRYPDPACVATGRQCNFIENNYTQTDICGRMIKTGNNSSFVESICGQPAEEKINSSYVIKIEKMTYGDSGKSTLVFEDNKLKDWTY